MTPKEKQRLFKVLCAMLPYEVVVHTDHGDIKLDKNHCGIGMLYYEHYSEEAKKECGYNENDCSIIISGCYYGDVKPYLRPMLSMTAEEAEIYNDFVNRLSDYNCNTEQEANEMNDWLLSRHFDVRGLIPMGLALVALDGMYKTE